MGGVLGGLALSRFVFVPLMRLHMKHVDRLQVVSYSLQNKILIPFT